MADDCASERCCPARPESRTGRGQGGWGSRRARGAGRGCHVELGAPARPGRPGARCSAGLARHSPAGSRPQRYARHHARGRARRGSLLTGRSVRGPLPEPGLRRRRRAALTAALYGGARRAGDGAAGGAAQVRPAPGPGPHSQRAEARARRGARPPASTRSWSRRGRWNWNCGGTSRHAPAPATTWATGTTWTTRCRRRRTPACAARSPRRTPTYVKACTPSRQPCPQPRMIPVDR